MPATVTKLDAWRAAHSRPVVIDCCRWSEAIETVLATNLRLLFAWQRVALRSIWRL